MFALSWLRSRRRRHRRYRQGVERSKKAQNTVKRDMTCREKKKMVVAETSFGSESIARVVPFSPTIGIFQGVGILI